MNVTYVPNVGCSFVNSDTQGWAHEIRTRLVDSGIPQYTILDGGDVPC